LIIGGQGDEIMVKAPSQPGAYRLFAYVFDGIGHAAHVNIPFYVDSPGKPPFINALSASAIKQ
jgi:hypothetical protein